MDLLNLARDLRRKGAVSWRTLAQSIDYTGQVMFNQVTWAAFGNRVSLLETLSVATLIAVCLCTPHSRSIGAYVPSKFQLVVSLHFLCHYLAVLACRARCSQAGSWRPC